MAHAWLDSLSEDWVSQPGSDASDVQLPPLKQDADATPSKIPRRPGANPVYSPITGNSSNILNERTPNEINISHHKLPSKLSRELKLDSRDSRSVSAATFGSVVHNSVESASQKNHGTPEWKRRLVNGDLQYGEQRDLFCCAGTGLQDMFKPPQAGPEKLQSAQTLPDRTMPSSPPLYQYQPDEDIDRLLALAEADDQDFPEQVTPSPSPRRGNRDIHFRSTSNGNSSFLPPLSEDNYVDESPLQHVGAIARNRVSLNAPRHTEACHTEGQLRQASGQTDIGNEDFSPIVVGRHDEGDGQVRFGAMNIPIHELQSKLERVQKDQTSDTYNESPSLGATIERPSEIEAVERFARNAGHVNLQRGGRSGDGSFYTRALSPDLGVDTSEMLPEESLQASTPKEFPTIRTQLPSRGISYSMDSPSLPRAPFPSPDKRSIKTSGSPLKLFGPYDTFTNQTLLRRISQFEDVGSGDSSAQGVGQESPAHGDTMDQSRRSVSYFGGGQLDDYEFTADISEACDIFDGTDKENVSPEAFMIPIGSRRHMSVGNVSRLLVSRRRDRSGASVDTAEIKRPDIAKDVPELHGTSRRDLEAFDTKRSMNCPAKDPTPKRRRTLRCSDAAHGREDKLSQVDAAHQQMQSAMGKELNDARLGQAQIADADAVAGRVILKPCSPASSRKSSQQHGNAAERLNKAGSAPPETERKPSIRTQDFVDQAAQIMAMIRNQVKPTGLASLEESEEENNTGAEAAWEPAEGSRADSTYEPLSRPPSREGKQSPNYQERPSDPELEARLKQYKEMSDMGDVVTSSLRSVSMAQEAIRAAQDLERQIQQTTFGHGSASMLDVVGDLVNVRISGPFVNSSPPASPSKEFSSNSSARSTNTVPTTSSVNSDSKRTIMPESVSHLISDRVGSMYLDKAKNIWIKKKEPNVERQNESAATGDDSEEDPFASIPDLTVDMTQELRTMKGVMNGGEKNDAAGKPSSPLPPQTVFIPFLPGQVDEDVEEFRNTERRETYKTQKGTAKRRNMTISFSSPIASIIQDAVLADTGSFEDDATPRSVLDHEKSPESSPADNFSGRPALRQADNKSRPPTLRYASIQGPDFVRRPVSPINEQDEDSTVELLANEANQVGFVGEQSLMNCGGRESRQTSLSVIISRTPGNKSLALVGDESAIIGQNIGHMSLSPLSEFNANHADQSFGFEVSYVLGNRHLSTGDGSKKVMSLTLRELVDRLSEVEPCEPHWQDLEELNLSEKRLSSLHMLEEFCGKVVTLDASQNTLGHLEGVPPSVRQLKVSQNMLTELTSWNHLVNLQYVDISGNEIKSLSALRHLVHLRSVKADNNKLTSLDGLDSHDGLLSLRARGNLIEELDFEDSALNRLTELDLSGNSIEVVRNIHLAPCLSKLKLSNNRLQTLEASPSAKAIRHLDVSQNKLTHLDVSGFPGLHTLLADGNQLQGVSGLQRTRRLDCLSLREQGGQGQLDLGFLSVGYEVRKLFLSGNYLDSFEPKVDMLNLQLLELANCGLSSLPENFGQLMPNLRSLNINFNAISNVNALRYIPRLKKLLVAGNRLADSTSVTKLLMDFPHLTRLDTRDNPMTLGFYAPLQALVQAYGGETTAPFTLPDADEERDELYASRLDEPTKLRRRLHRVALAASCSRLRMLDGLLMRQKQALAMDSVLKALVEEGLVEGCEQQEEARQEADDVAEEKAADCGEEAQSSRWNAEDSFA